MAQTGCMGSLWIWICSRPTDSRSRATLLAKASAFSSLGIRSRGWKVTANIPPGLRQARARRVTRQRIQTLVNSLQRSHLVKTTSNPASKRSPLITLTDAGSKTILAMRKREGEVMKVPVSDKKIVAAADTLAALRAALEEGRTQ